MAKSTQEILAVTDGTVKELKTLKDGVFSEKMLGDGAVIDVAKADEFTVYAPISGKLVTVFETGHAYGIKSKDGVEVLVHIGLDTVNLEGEGFKQLVKQDKKIKAGAPMAVVDAKAIRSKVPSVNPIVLVTSGQSVSVNTGAVKKDDVMFTLG